MFNSENAQKKWAPLLEHSDCAPIKDSYRKAVTAVLLENQEKAMRETAAHSSFSLNEDVATTDYSLAGDAKNFDPVLIALVRRAMPSLIAYDIAGVQPMSGPTGLIFSMIATHQANNRGITVTSGAGANEALFDEANSAFSGNSPDGKGYSREAGELLSGSKTTSDGQLNSMGFEIRKATVTATTRALRAGYTMELAQDLKAIHGLDAEAELANILSTEILAEINREVIGRIQTEATSFEVGSSASPRFDGTATADTLGARWAQEKFQALAYQIEKAANAIGVATRRGKGNFVIVSPNVGSALAASGYLQYGEALEKNGLSIDAQVNTFAGTLNGSIKVYVDPYHVSGDPEVTVGYRGSSPYDAGVFYCPYVPLTMVKAVGEEDFQPRIAFKTRYGMVSNPYAVTYSGNENTDGSGGTSNPYFQKFDVVNL
jgi:hypothetical protein